MKKLQIRAFEKYYFNISETDFQNVYNIIRYLKGQEELVTANQPWAAHINYINSNIDSLYFEKCKSFFDLSKAMFEIGCIDLSKHAPTMLLTDVLANSGVPHVEQILSQLGPQIKGIVAGDVLEIDSAYRKHSNETANDGGYGIKLLLKSEVSEFLEEFDEDVISDINLAFLNSKEENLQSFDIPKWCRDLTEKWKDTFVEDDVAAENYANILSKIYPLALLASTPGSSDITPFDTLATVYNETLDQEIKFSYASIIEASKNPGWLKTLINKNNLFNTLASFPSESYSSADLKPGIPNSKPEKLLTEANSDTNSFTAKELGRIKAVRDSVEFDNEVIKRLNTIENIARTTLESVGQSSLSRQEGKTSVASNSGHYAYAFDDASVYIEPSKSDNKSYNDGSDNSPVNSKSVRETRKADKEMEEQGFFGKVIDTAKEDGKDALLRVTVKQTIKTVKAPLVEAFASRAGGTNKREKNKNMKIAADFLDSELGEAFICQVIAAALVHMPIGGNEEIRDVLAKEFRVQGYTELGSMVVDYLMDPIRDSLSALTSALKEGDLAPAIAAAKEVSAVEVPPPAKEVKPMSTKKVKQSVNA